MTDPLRHPRFRTSILLLGALVAGFITLTPLQAQVAPADSAFFVHVTQQMLDAITSGDTTVWARELAPDWIEADEEGRYISRADLLGGLHPLPPGQHGTLTLDRWRLMGGGDMVVMTYDADEVHDYYGQRLVTVFHSTDTWVRRGGKWWQIATQQTALPRPVAGESILREEAAADTGTYRLTPTIRMQVVADDSGLTVGRVGTPGQRLYQLTAGIFVRHGARGFWVFERDTLSHAVRLVNWRDNNRVAFERQP